MKSHQTARLPRSVKAVSVLGAVALLLAFGGCGKKEEDQTVGQKLDAAVEKTEQAASDAKAKTEDSLAKAVDALKEQTQKVQDSGKKTAESLVEKLDDASITASIAAELAKDSDLSVLKIDVDTKAGVVTLYGPAPSDAARDKATSIAKSIKGVTSVNNKLVVKSN